MVFQVVEARSALDIHKCGDSRGDRPWAALVLQPESYRAPLGRDALRVEYLKTMSGSGADHRLHRKRRYVLVIDHIEQRFFKHVERILRLENKCSIRREQHLDPSEDLIEIIDIRHGIVGDDRARRTFLGAYGDRDRKGEEFAERWNAVARRFRGDLLCRIDA